MLERLRLGRLGLARLRTRCHGSETLDLQSRCYYATLVGKSEDLALMRLIDEQYNAAPVLWQSQDERLLSVLLDCAGKTQAPRA